MKAVVAALCACLAEPWAAATAAPAAGAQAGYEPMTLYVLRQGDTLEGLAVRYMTGRADAALVVRLNSVHDTFRMPIGMILRIPTRLLRSQPIAMSVASLSGVVIRAPASGRPAPLAKGAAIHEGDRISTAADAFVTLIQTDGSRVTLPSRTTIRIGVLRRVVLGDNAQSEITVETGRGEMGVTPLRKAGDRFEIRTPASVAAVRGTEFRVAYDAGKSVATLEVILGRVGESASAGGDPALVQTGEAVQRPLGGERRFIPLPPAPELAPPAKTQKEPGLIFRIAEPATGWRYHFQLARDGDFTDIFSEMMTAGEARFPSPPPGSLYVRISSLTPDGVEGLAKIYDVERLIDPHPRSAATSDAGSDVAGNPG